MQTKQHEDEGEEVTADRSTGHVNTNGKHTCPHCMTDMILGCIGGSEEPTRVYCSSCDKPFAAWEETIEQQFTAMIEEDN